MKKLKILHLVEFYYPSLGGAQEVVRILSERMVAMGHDVTVATTKLSNRESLNISGVKIEEFDVSGNSVNGIKGQKKKYQDFLIHSDFDVVMGYANQQWTVDAFLEVIDRVKAKKVLVPCGYSALYDPAYKNYFKKLPDILKKFDATVYLSNDYRDINFAREHGVDNLHVIPNGADEKEFGSTLSSEETIRIKNKYGLGGLVLMTLGNYTGEKGHAELLRVFRKLPVSKATLVSAGTIRPHDGCFDMFEMEAWKINQSRKMINKRVVMVDGGNREDIVKLMKVTDIFVFFSNIEASPLVIFEAAAAGTPFVASSAGNMAEQAEWLRSGVIVECDKRPNGRVAINERSALIELAKLSHNPSKRKEMGALGRGIWEKKYTWEKITNSYIRLYEKVLGEMK